jgi:hypothetical protein
MAIPEDQRIVPLANRLPQYEDELSLVDLFLVLERRKHLIAAVFAVIALAGILYAAIRTPSHEYTSSIQLGRGVSGLLESPAVVVAKLNESHIPYVRYEAAEHGMELPRLVAQAPKDGDIIILRSSGPAADAPQHEEAHRLVIERLVRDQADLLEAARRSFQAEANRIISRVERLRAENELIAERKARLTEQESALRRSLEELREEIAAAERKRDGLARRSDAQSMATLVFVDGELSRLRERQQQTMQELHTGIALAREAVRTAELDNLAQQAEAQEKLGELESRQQLLRASAAMTPTIRAAETSGPGAAVMVVISLMLGLGAGIFLAFLAEFLARARERRQSGGKI